MIGPRTATLLYLLLCIAAFALMNGKALALLFIIILGTAAKSYLHYWKQQDVIRLGAEHRIGLS